MPVAVPVPGPVPAAVPRPAARGPGERAGRRGRRAVSHGAPRVPASVPRRGAWTRRALLAAGAVVVGQALSGCAPRAGRATQPAPSHPPRTISAMLDVGAYFAYGTAQERAQLFTQALEEGFYPRHKGIRVRLLPWTAWPPKVTALLAGKGPDVFADFYLAPFVEHGIAMALDGYLQRDNIDAAIWSAPVMASYRLGGGLFALNRNLSPSAILTRRSVWNDTGIALPDPEWDHVEYERVAASLTANKGGKHRFGTSLAVYPNQIGDQSWIYRAFGGSQLDASHTRQVLGSPASVRAGQWVYERMVWPKIAAQDAAPSMLLDGGLAMLEEQAVNLLVGTSGLLQAGVRDMLWLPVPVYPAGHFGWISDNLWAANAATKDPEASWALLKWLTVETGWQRLVAKLFLVPPCLISLWPEWTSIVEGTVPVFKGRGLPWFTKAAQGNWGSTWEYFRYSDVTAEQINDPWIKKVSARQVGVAQGFAQADAQVNAYEAQQAAQARRASAGSGSGGSAGG